MRDWLSSIDFADWDWTNTVTVTVAVIAAGVAIFNAERSRRASRIAQQAEADAARLRMLEERLAQRKEDVYRPIVEALGGLFDKTGGEDAQKQRLKDLEPVLQKFTTLLPVWGSEKVVLTFFLFRTLSSHSPPSEVTFRLVGDFLAAIREDITGVQDSISGYEIFGLRINDLDKNPQYIRAFELSLEGLAKEHNWALPDFARHVIAKGKVRKQPAR